MSTSIYYLIFSVILIAGVLFTILIGKSKPNRDGNPEYDNKTRGNWSRLTLFYVIAIALGILALLVYIVKTTAQ
ncbi:hypothetical protein [Paenibacillus sp. SI8]|uniref:hypothetical protein n=1 Tax=unclassified Paenibacillus TaxID=185978 RepID=UPI003465D90F